MKKRAARLVESKVLVGAICAIFVLVSVAAVLFPMSADAAGETTLDISLGSITISETGANGGGVSESTFNPAGYIIVMGTGTSTTNTITVTASTTVTISGVSIDVSGTESACSFSIESNATVNLILENKNTLKSGKDKAGVQVSSGAAVVINGTGSLDVTGGGRAAGIGGGYYCDGGTITIEGSAEVTALGADSGAGIGGGDEGDGGTFTIKGDAEVTATGDLGGAGIGGGEHGTNGKVMITDNAKVTASSNGDGGAGIGGGFRGFGGTIAIEGNAEVVATGGFNRAGIEGGAGIGGGDYCAGGIIMIKDYATVTATGGEGGAGIGGGSNGAGGTITIEGNATVTATGRRSSRGNGGAGIGGGYQGVGGTITIAGSVEVTATGESYAAGIGGGYQGAGGTIIISDNAEVAATGGFTGTGIGGGYQADGGTITIEDNAVITAIGGDSGAGIGCSAEGEGVTVNIYGGAVTATGGSGGAGIGGGTYYAGGTVNIQGGTVKATGGLFGAGIGGGNMGAGGSIIIEGGIIYAEKGGGATQDIGTGQDGSGGTISISGEAAVFLKSGSCITPTTLTHTLLSFDTVTDDKIYGLDVPVTWAVPVYVYLNENCLYQLEYDANGGIGTVPETVTQYIGTMVSVVDGCGLTNDGYPFSAWNTTSDNIGDNYPPDDEFALSASTILYAQYGFPLGDGSKENPYGISTPEQLNAVRSFPDANFILLNDIDMTEATNEGGAYWNDGTGWEPIYELYGSFNGNGFCIIGLNIIRPKDQYIGFFRIIREGAKICNLGMVDSYIYGGLYQAGGICAHCEGTIEYCYNTGHICGNALASVGGITASLSYDGLISCCYNTGYIEVVKINGSGLGQVGGIAGTAYYNDGGTIINCFNTGTIIGREDAVVGGIAGWGGLGIYNCYNVGSVASFEDDGTLVGWLMQAYQNSGLYYYQSNECLTGASEPDGDRVAYGTALSKEEMKLQSSFAEFDFDTVWTMGGNDQYPYPELRGMALDIAENTEEFSGGNGLPYDPYQVATLEQLDNIRNYLGSSFVLLNDIDLTEAVEEDGIFYNDGEGFKPIGNGEDVFCGNLDGSGYNITGLRVVCTYDLYATDYAGLFGYCVNATINNLGIIDAYLSGDLAGGIMACGSNNIISDCNVSGQVTTLYESGKIGGITGRTWSGRIQNCYNNAEVFGVGNIAAGGIVGYSYSTEIDSCYNTGSISASYYYAYYVSGIVGYSTGNITNCFNTGNISNSKNQYEAGIVSYNQGVVSNCYNIGTAQNPIGTASFNYGSFSNCYYLQTDSSLFDDGLEGTFEETYLEMLIMDTYAGFDFNSIWEIEEGRFPVLQDVHFEYLTGLSIEDAIDINLGESEYLSIIITPTEASNQTISWLSSDDEIVSVSDGLLTSHKVGIVTITVISQDGRISDTCEVSSIIHVSSVTINKETLGLSVGDSETLIASVLPLDATYPTVTWSSSNIEVATVDQTGKVTAVAPGSATITATADGISDTCEITVEKPVSNVTLSSDAETMTDGDILTLTAEVLPSDATYPTVTWSSSDTNVATVDQNGKVTGVSAGEATITATADGQSATCRVAVQSAQYTISATSNNTTYGAVAGGGAYDKGASVTLTATPKAGGRFVCWKNGTTQVSTSATYTFAASADVTLTAEFASIGTPAVSAASSGYDRILLSWSAVEGAAGYEVWRSLSSGGAYTKINISSGTSYTDTGLATNTAYYYKVNAYCTSSTATTYGSLSAYAAVVPIPSAPSGVAAVITSYSSVQVTWNAVDGASGYCVYRATSPNGVYSSIKTTTSLSYTNTSLKTGTTYYYKVCPYRVVGRSKVFGDYSVIVSVTPVLSPIATASAAAYSPTGVKISWSSVSGRTRYEVWRSTSPDSGFALTKTTSSTSFKDTTLTPFVTYYYQIKVYRTVSGQKIYAVANSPTVSATPILNDVTNVRAAMYSVTSVKLSWSSVSGASGYEVLRRDASSSQYTVIASTTRKYYTDKNLIPNQTYSYQVRAYRTVSGTRVYSAACSPVSATPVFGSVTNPGAVRSSATKIKLTWTVVSGRSGYEIYRATAADGEYVLIGSTKKTSYYDSGLTTGTPSYYMIRAYVTVNGVKQYSDYSVVVTATP